MLRVPFLGALAASVALTAGEAQPPAPVPVDAGTTARAEVAAEAYLRELAENEKRIDPDAAERCSQAEKLIASAQFLIERGEMAKAGDAFVAATNHIKAVPTGQRVYLGKRYRAIQDRLTEVGRVLLGGLPGEPAPPPASPSAAK